MENTEVNFTDGRTLLNESDLVKLGILSKQVSEYTDADIGSIISIPYNDESGKITLKDGCIEFEVVGVNHHKDINDETKSTITLMAKNIIRPTVFDGKEPDNPDGNRASCGNNRWSVSNIRQWLNSEGKPNEWFTVQHEYDAEPNSNNVDYFGHFDYGSYLEDPGFLTGFSDEIKQHFATVKNKTILCHSDKFTLSKDFEETNDKVFLPSYTEIGFGNLDDNTPEGVHLSKKFTDDNSRSKNGDVCKVPGYWTRSPWPDNTSITCYVFSDNSCGFDHYFHACHNRVGVTPIIVLC